MRIKCIGCDALARVIYLCAAQSPHLVDVTLLRLGLHRKPADLQVRLQREIDNVTQERLENGLTYDAIVMVYGLCGRSTAGIVARDIPVIIPARMTASPFFWAAARATKNSTKNSRARTGIRPTISSAVRKMAR